MRISDVFQKLAGPNPPFRCHRARELRKIEPGCRMTEWLFLEHAPLKRFYCSALHASETRGDPSVEFDQDPLAQIFEVLHLGEGIESDDVRFWKSASSSLESAMSAIAEEHDRLMKLARTIKPRPARSPGLELGPPPNDRQMKEMRRVERQVGQWVDNRQLFWQAQGS